MYRQGVNYNAEVNAYTVENIAYDLNGNIETLQRNGGTNLVIDDLTYAYNGNQLKSVSDLGTVDGFTNGASTTDEYGYDANGNMIRDDNKGITGITYNHLNLPEVVTLTGGTITFLYDANGTKLRKTVSTGVQQDYLGGIEYTNGAIDAIYHEEGRATLQSGVWRYEYYLKDHLGNTRVIFTDSDDNGEPEIIQEADYYPFGMRHQNTTATNHYLYNGKELNTDLGLDWYDYGARWLDMETGRWNGIDPLSESYESWSPFHYVLNNPITHIDRDGKSAEIIISGKTITIKAKIYTQGLSDNLVSELNRDYSKYIQSGTYTDGAKNKYTVKFDLKYEADKVGAFNKDNVGNGVNLLKVIKDPKDCTICLKSGRSAVWGVAKSYGELTGSRKYYPPTIFHESAHFLGLSDRYSYKTGRMDAKFGHDLLNNRAAKFSQVHINNLAGFALFNTYYLDRKNETDGKYYINRMVDRRGRKLTSIYRPIFGLEGSKNIETINPPLLR